MVGRTALVPLALLALVALGCGARAYDGTLRRPDGRAMVRLERQAQRDMHCRSPLHVLALETTAFQVDGCGQMREYAYVCPGRRCSFQPMVPAVVRASQDLQCAPQQLVASADSPTHRAFFGCMRGVAYNLLCVDHGCTWSRTPESVTVASAAPAPTYVAAPLPPPAVDPTLVDVAIPPPPGAPSAFAPASTPAPAPAIIPPPPPPASAAPTPAPAPATIDSVVIPPPPS